MNNRFKLIGFLMIIASCKYEDGPLLSLISAETRIAGYYEVDFVTEDGINQMDKIDTLNINYFYFGIEDSYIHYEHAFSVWISDTISYPGYWTLLSDDSEIYFQTLGCDGLYSNEPVSLEPLPGFLSDGTCALPGPTWTITKLTQKRVWLKTTFNGKDYEVHFKQIKS